MRYVDEHAAPTDLLAIAAGLGVRVRSEPIGGDRRFTGATFTDHDAFHLIVVNSLVPLGRWAFTVAHELGHIVLEHRPPRNPWYERMADLYAVELLMPERRIRRQFVEIGHDPILLARVNSVSVMAMSRRFAELGLANGGVSHEPVRGDEC